MRRFHLLLILVSAILFSCSNYEDDALNVNEFNVLNEFQGVQKDILVNVLSMHYGGYSKNSQKTRASLDFSITPYIHDGDTVMYVVQYHKGGWELYSANQKVNSILFTSPIGYFNIFDKKMPDAVKDIIVENAEAIKNIPEDINAPINRSWGASSVTEEDFRRGKITLNKRSDTRASRIINYDEVPRGQWVLLSSETTSSTNTSPKLTKTEWGQVSPWNTYAKCFTNSKGEVQRGFAGCVPVAVGQYLYYTHYKDNTPLYAVTTASPINDGKDFVFYGLSSSIWDQMALSEYSEGSCRPVAVFLGHLGRELNAIYKEDGTFASTVKMMDYLNNVYGVTFKENEFNFNYIEKSINKSMPVLATAGSNSDSDGTPKTEVGYHCFIIDRYEITNKTTKLLYGLIRDPWTGPGPDPYDDNVMDADGNVECWAYTNEVYIYNTSRKISMNWGYRGFYDYLFYSADSYDLCWNAGGHKFNLSHLIYTRSDIR